VQRVVGAGEDPGVAVVTANLLLHFSLILALAFGEENEIGPLEGIGRFAENTAGEDVAVPERILTVHEEKVKAVAESEILVTVIQEEGISAVVADGVAGRFHAVGIDEHGDAGKVAGEHEGFVAGLGGVEQDGFSVRNNAGRGRGSAGEEAVGEAGEKGLGDGFIAAAQDGDAAAGVLKGAGELFHHRGLAGPADGEVADADDEGAHGVTPENGVVVELGPDPHDSGIDGGEAKEDRFEQGGPAPGGTVEDNVRGELLEGFKSSESHKGRMEGFRLGGRTRMGLEVERFQERGGFSPRGRIGVNGGG
jgi:hypothetical protein